MNLLIHMLVLRGTESGGRRSVHVSTLKREGGRGSLVGQADWKMNVPRSFSRFAGNGFGGGGEGGMGSCKEVGQGLY